MPDEDDPPDLDVYLFARCRTRLERVQQEHRRHDRYAAACRRYHACSGARTDSGSCDHRSGHGSCHGRFGHVPGWQRLGDGADAQRYRRGAGQRFDRCALSS
jgi:hypothetical protein